METRKVREHVSRCQRCTQEVDHTRKLMTALDQLPRFAPSARFADAVMARVDLSQQAVPARGSSFGQLLASRSGWAVLGATISAPAVALMVVAGLIFSQPLATPAVLWEWLLPRVQVVNEGALGWLINQLNSPEVRNALTTAYSAFETIPPVALAAAALVFTLGMPLSLWGLIRLTRSSWSGRVTYAN
ncbi:MAG: hypothetical protein LBG44_07370 [Gemmatimonadota bacterium]|nr:hypothetical protein [Gemmatimonadota bacterium]